MWRAQCQSRLSLDREIGRLLDGLTARAADDTSSDLLFSDDLGKDVFGYKDLKAWDASGDVLDATMYASSDGFVLTLTNALDITIGTF